MFYEKNSFQKRLYRYAKNLINFLLNVFFLSCATTPLSFTPILPLQLNFYLHIDGNNVYKKWLLILLQGGPK
jgi:hypothetical protein